MNNLDPSVTSGVDNVLSVGTRHGSSNVLSREASNDAGVRASHGSGRTVNVGLAVAAKTALASGTTGSKDLAGKTSLRRGHDVLESIALSDDLGTSVGLESVTGVGVEVVADGVEKGVASDLWRAARGVVDVVALEGDHVVAAGEVDSPVVVAIAGGGPGGGAVDLVVGDGNTAGRTLTKDNVLAGNQVGGTVVDPDHVACNYRLLDTG